MGTERNAERIVIKIKMELKGKQEAYSDMPIYSVRTIYSVKKHGLLYIAGQKFPNVFIQDSCWDSQEKAQLHCDLANGKITEERIYSIFPDDLEITFNHSPIKPEKQKISWIQGAIWMRNKIMNELNLK